MSTEKNGPQIVIIGEWHPIRIVEFVVTMTAPLAEAKILSTSEEIKPLLEQLNGLAKYAKLIAEHNMDYIKKFKEATVLFEFPIEEKKKNIEEPERDPGKFFEFLKSTFGENYTQTFKDAWDATTLYEKVYKKIAPLEINLLTKAGHSLNNIFDIVVREFPTTIRIVRMAKAAVKRQNRMLIICGMDHAQRYAHVLRRLNYDCELVTTPGGDISEKMLKLRKELSVFLEKKLAEKTAHDLQVLKEMERRLDLGD